jgi:DNA sulfur modification protein DndE
MTWKVFGGTHHPIYWALVRQRCKEDGFELTEDILAEQFRLHLHRGIAYLAGDKTIKTIEDLIQRGVEPRVDSEAFSLH